MLNERWEYDFCLTETTTGTPLQQSSLEKREGFRRLLRILAKGFLEKCEEQGLNRDDSIRYCRGFLETWVTGATPQGFTIPDSCSELLAELRKAETYNLIRHADELQKGSIKDASQLPVREEKLKNDVKGFAEAPYQHSWNVKRNDFNRIYYDQIIADALNRKPLRNQCLVMKESGAASISCADNLRKITLAVVCMYLQDLDEFQRPVKSAYLPITQAEIGNWLHVRVKKKGRNSNAACVALAIERACWASPAVPLFDKQAMVNISKIRVDPNWLNAYDVRLMDAEEAEILQAPYIKLDDSYFLG